MNLWLLLCAVPVAAVLAGVAVGARDCAQPKSCCPNCGRTNVWYRPDCPRCGYDLFHGRAPR